jgi:hypothetical protein
MSDHASHDAASASQDAPLFSAVEVEQFSADDVTAGSAIGKMLSALFLYTILRWQLLDGGHIHRSRRITHGQVLSRVKQPIRQRTKPLIDFR